MNIALCLALSTHISLPGEWNEVHPCLRLRQDVFIAGVFLNSENTVSTYAGVELIYKKTFLELGVVTGYSDADVLPFIRAGIMLDENLKLFVAPAYTEDNVGAVLGVEYTFR